MLPARPALVPARSLLVLRAAVAPLAVGALVYLISCLLEPSHWWPTNYARSLVAMSEAPLAFRGPMPERILSPLLAHWLGCEGERYVAFTQGTAVALLAIVFHYCRRRGVRFGDAVLITAGIGWTGMIQVYKSYAGLSDMMTAALIVLGLTLVRRGGWFWSVHMLNLLNHGMALYFVPWFLLIRRTQAGARLRHDAIGAGLTTAGYLAFRAFVNARADGQAYDLAFFLQQAEMLGGLVRIGLYSMVVIHSLVVFGPLLAVMLWHLRARPADRPVWSLLLVCAAIAGMLFIATDVFRFANFVFLPLLLASVRFVGDRRSRLVYGALLAGSVVTFGTLNEHVMPHFTNVILQCNVLGDHARMLTCLLPRTWPIYLAFAIALALLWWLAQVLRRRQVGAGVA